MENHRCRTQIYGTLHLPLRGYTVLRFLRGLRGFAVEDRDGDRLGREDEYDVVTSSYKFAESGYKCGERIFGSFAGSGEDLRESCRRCAGSERIRGVSPVMRGFMGASPEMGLSITRDVPERFWRCVGALPPAGYAASQTPTTVPEDTAYCAHPNQAYPTTAATAPVAAPVQQAAAAAPPLTTTLTTESICVAGG
ncbi:unnamed protein product [Brassica oleracea var. botrytis]|uniref:(rape) hypothetical protein n=1 Tax=Brassica napus TaxID=3708 RepID=A0A816M7U1_BRANA|nr:unnamed protein product [Brassica napus]